MPSTLDIATSALLKCIPLPVITPIYSMIVASLISLNNHNNEITKLKTWKCPIFLNIRKNLSVI
jgi:hypothetical protein